MRIMTVYSFIIILCTNLGCSIKGEHKNSDYLNSDKIEPVDNSEQDYLDIKNSYRHNHYLILSSSISSFIDKYPKSNYTDSVKYIWTQIELLKSQENSKRDSLSRFNSVVYFKNLGLPTLDSITEKSYKIIDHNCKFDFTDFDNKLFKSPYDHNWYLSIQNVGAMKCIAVCHFIDCENDISLYSIDSLFNIRSSKTIYFNGCIGEPAPNFPFNGQIINEYKRKNWTMFNRDNTFTIIDRTYFTIKDTKKGNTTVEIGREINITYTISLDGKFVVVEDKSFTKDYVTPLYKVPV